jgi:hypothetical protein
MTQGRKPIAATFSRPIPSLAQLAATLALGAGGCKSDKPAPDTTPPPPRAPPPASTVASPSTPPAVDASVGVALADADADAGIRTVSVPKGGNPFQYVHGDPPPAGGLANVQYPPDQTIRNQALIDQLEMLGTAYDGAAAPSFQSAAAGASLSSAAASVGSCKQPGAPTGHGHVLVTFAPSGAPVQVTVSPPFAGTIEETCIANQFRRAARAPAFDPTAGNKSMTTGIDIE